MTDPTTINPAAHEAAVRLAAELDKLRLPWNLPKGVRDDIRAVLEWVDDLHCERDGHQRRQIWAENALMVMLEREGGSVEITPTEAARAQADGSFVTSQNAATGGECIEFRAANPQPERQEAGR